MDDKGGAQARAQALRPSRQLAQGAVGEHKDGAHQGGPGTHEGGKGDGEQQCGRQGAPASEKGNRQGGYQSSENSEMLTGEGEYMRTSRPAKGVGKPGVHIIPHTQDQGFQERRSLPAGPPEGMGKAPDRAGSDAGPLAPSPEDPHAGSLREERGREAGLPRRKAALGANENPRRDGLRLSSYYQDKRPPGGCPSVVPGARGAQGQRVSPAAPLHGRGIRRRDPLHPLHAGGRQTQRGGSRRLSRPAARDRGKKEGG